MFNVSNDTNTYDYMNSFFGGTNSTNSSSGPSSLLGDWYAVQNGIYFKLAKKFYASEAAQEAKTPETVEKELTMAKEAAESAVSSLNKLMDDDLYKKVKTQDEDGNTKYDYNRDDILKNIKSYIEEYNSVIKNMGELEDTQTLKNGVRLVSQAKVYGSALAKVGITIKSDNTLEIDEEAFDKVDMADVKNLFTGGVSYGKNMQTKLLQIHTAASNNISTVNGLYDFSGNYAKSTGQMFDSML